MSIYYNFKMNADRTEKSPARFDSQGGSGNVVDNSSLYEVGINRFKIPISDIPLYRIYENDLQLGFTSRGGGSTTQAGARVGRVNATNMRSAFFDGECIHRQDDDRYGIDTLRQNRKYVEIFSQNEFVKLMNKGLCRSMFQLGQSLNTGFPVASPGIHSIAIAGAVNIGQGVNGITNIGTALTIPERADLNGVSQGSIITGLRLRIDQMTIPAGFSFADFTFYLQRDDIGGIAGDSNKFVLCKNNLFGERGVNMTAGNNNNSIEFSSRSLSHIDGHTQINNNLYTNHTLSASNNPFQMFITESDMTEIVGKRADGYTYTLKCFNHTEVAMDVACPVMTIPAGQIVCDIFVMDLLDNITDLVPTSALPQKAYQMPKFTLGADGKISFNNNNATYLLGNYSLYMNNRLESLMSFGEFNVDKITNLATFQNYFVDNGLGGAQYGPNDNGSIFTFPARIEGTGDINASSKGLVFTENFDTSFMRDFLNSIIITSGSLTIQGEFIGTGESSRKILTDFVLDPANINRDYCLFNNSGGMRFYKLQSTQPVRKLDVIIQYEDIYGIVRNLFIKPNEECSLKIEFRPNNMLFNYESNFSTN